jgi:hypothetical protein
MKHTSLILTVLGFAAILQPACSKNDSTSQAVESTKTAAKDIATAVKDTAVDTWDNIKDYTYEKRADFAEHIDRMAAKRDAEVAELNAKVTGLPDTAAKARDQANKDFADARAYLKTQTEHVRTATADTWDDAKEKTAEAWKRVQAAYEKVKSSPTS